MSDSPSIGRSALDVRPRPRRCLFLLSSLINSAGAVYQDCRSKRQKSEPDEAANDRCQRQPIQNVTGHKRVEQCLTWVLPNVFLCLADEILDLFLSVADTAHNNIL